MILVSGLNGLLGRLAPYRPVKSSVVCPSTRTVGIASIKSMYNGPDDLDALDGVLQFYTGSYNHVICL